MESLERDPLVVLCDVARLVRTLADARAREHGMTRAQWMILVRLDRQPGMSQNELATLIEVEPITVGRLVDRLEARGLIERRPDPADRRIRRLHLLPAAEAIITKIDAYRTELNAYLMEGVSQKERETALNLLLHMKNKLTME